MAGRTVFSSIQSRKGYVSFPSGWNCKFLGNNYAKLIRRLFKHVQWTEEHSDGSVDTRGIHQVEVHKIEGRQQLPADAMNISLTQTEVIDTRLHHQAKTCVATTHSQLHCIDLFGN